MINVKKFIEAEFASAEHMRNEFLDLGLKPPELDSIQKWSRRNSIPGNWLAAALAMREAFMSKPISVLPYIEGGKLECSLSSNAKLLHTGEQPNVFD